MKNLLTTTALAALLAACAQTPTADGQKVASRADRDAPLGTLFSKKSGGSSTAREMDRTQLENMKMAGAAEINLPQARIGQ